MPLQSIRLKRYLPDNPRARWAHPSAVPSDVVHVDVPKGRYAGMYVGAFRVSSANELSNMANIEFQSSHPLRKNEDGGRKYAERSKDIEDALGRVFNDIPPELDFVIRFMVRPDLKPKIKEGVDLADIVFPDLRVTVEIDFGWAKRELLERRKRHKEFLQKSVFNQRRSIVNWWFWSWVPFVGDDRYEEYLNDEKAAVNKVVGSTPVEQAIGKIGRPQMERRLVEEFGEHMRSLFRAIFANDDDLRAALEKRGLYVGPSTKVVSDEEIEKLLGGRERIHGEEG